MRLKHLAAHLSGFVPSSSLICSADGDDESGAGGGAPPPSTPPAPATPASPPMFTPDQLAYIAEREEKARNAGAAAARRAAEGRQPKPGEAPQPKPPETPTPAAPTDALAILKLRDDFDDAVSDMTLTGAQKKFLREHVMDKRPADVAGYVRTFTETLGLGKPPSPVTPPAGGSPPPATPAAIASPMPGGAPPARVLTDDVHITSMSRADQAALAKRLGPFEFKNRLMRELAASGQRFSLRR